MHQKKHFKFQFNSSRNSTTSSLIIFFLNTTLHQHPHKIGTTQFGSTKLHLSFFKVGIQISKNELAFYSTDTDRRDPPISWAHVSMKRNRATARTRRGNGGARRRWLLRRRRRYKKHPHYLLHTLMQPIWPMVGAIDDGGGHGGAADFGWRWYARAGHGSAR